MNWYKILYIMHVKMKECPLFFTVVYYYFQLQCLFYCTICLSYRKSNAKINDIV